MILTSQVSKPQDLPRRKTLSNPSNGSLKSNSFGALNQKEPPPLHKLRKGPARDALTKRNYAKQSDVRDGQKSPASGQPFKALKMQRALTPVSYSKRNQVKEITEDRSSFNDFHLLSEIRSSISSQVFNGREDTSPSPIQRLAIPVLLSKNKETKIQECLLAAETGSGKTLAYLLPVIDAVKRAEKEERQRGEFQSPSEIKQASRDALFDLYKTPSPTTNHTSTSSGRPKAIILVPTAELVEQVGSTLKLLSHTIKFRSALLSSSYSGQVIRSRLFSPSGVDILVSTPHLLASILTSDPNVVSRVTHLVIDEADSLLDRSFSPTTREVWDRAQPSLKQLILCSATIPRNLNSFLEKFCPNITRLATPNLHAIPRRVQLSVVSIEGEPYKGKRDVACADLIWKLGTGREESYDEGSKHERDDVMRVIVFVNERETSDEIARFLQSEGIDAVALNRDSIARGQSMDVLADFTGASNKKTDHDAEETEKSRGSQRRVLQNVKVLVMTDIGSRGIDTLEVKNVILYHVPHTSIDFIHRLGRVGRMGRRGRGFVLVGKNDRKDIVKEVRTGMFMGKALI